MHRILAYYSATHLKHDDDDDVEMPYLKPKKWKVPIATVLRFSNSSNFLETVLQLILNKRKS